MSVLQHECVIAVTHDDAADKAFREWWFRLPADEQVFVAYLPGRANGAKYTIIGLSGSHEGWATAIEEGRARMKAVNFLRHDGRWDWVNISFGEKGAFILPGRMNAEEVRMRAADIHRAEVGYDLDLAGRRFEPCTTEPLAGCMSIDGHPEDLGELFPWVKNSVGEADDENTLGLVYFFSLAEEEPNWAGLELSTKSYYIYRLLGHGHLGRTDEPCPCPQDPCSRCGGKKVVDSPAGWWALYCYWGS